MNGWKRIPKSLKNDLRIETYMLGLRCPSWSVITVRRLARVMELRGVGPTGVYMELRRDFPCYRDLNNMVVEELRRRNRPSPDGPGLVFDPAKGRLVPRPGRKPYWEAA